MASHPNGGFHFAGDVQIDGDVTGQSVSAQNYTKTGTGTPISSDLFALTPGSVTPGAPAEGWVWANSVNHHIYYYSGSAWVQMDN